MIQNLHFDPHRVKDRFDCHLADCIMSGSIGVNAIRTDQRIGMIILHRTCDKNAAKYKEYDLWR